MKLSALALLIKIPILGQLSFNPFAKVWDDDYGLMYIALTNQLSNQDHALYTGSILRINPTPFGLRQFTIPSDNPFIGDDANSNALYVTGLGEIAEFIWPEKGRSLLLVRHQHQQKHQLSLVSAGQNLALSSSEATIATYDGNMVNQAMLSYQGRELAHLRNMTLLLESDENQWQVQSIKMPRQQDNLRTPLIEWQLPKTAENTHSSLALVKAANNEIVIFDKAKQVLSRLTTTMLTTIEDSHDETTKSSFAASNKYAPIINAIVGTIIVACCLWLAHFIYRKKNSARFNIRNQFTRFEIDFAQQTIELFKSHEQQANQTIPIRQITALSIALNKHEVAEISITSPFGNSADEQLRKQFAQEKRVKMQPDMMREITLVLTTTEQGVITICAYLRKGDHRVTRNDFTEACHHVVDLCWLVTKQIAPNDAEQRKFIPQVTEPPKALATLFTKPLHLKNTSKTTSELNHDENNQVNSTTVPNNTDKIDTELITALEKLAELKTQGALTQEEFDQAKQRVLQGLIS